MLMCTCNLSCWSTCGPRCCQFSFEVSFQSFKLPTVPIALEKVRASSTDTTTTPRAVPVGRINRTVTTHEPRYIGRVLPAVHDGRTIGLGTEQCRASYNVTAIYKPEGKWCRGTAMYGVRRISKESYSFISQLAHCECGNAAVYARLVVVVRLYIHTNSRWFLFFS